VKFIHVAVAVVALSTFACSSGDTPTATTPSTTTPKYAYVVSAQSGGATFDFAKSVSSGNLTSVTTEVLSTGSGAVAVHPTLHVAYVAENNGDIHQYTVTSSGLTAIATAISDATLTSPEYMEISPNGKFLYVVDDSAGVNGLVRTYTINQTTGELTQGNTFAGTDAGTTPDVANAIAIAPNNQWAYISYFSSQQVCAATIDSTTGELTQIGATCAAAAAGNFGIAVSQNSNMVYVSGIGTDLERFSINSGTGAITSVGTTTLPGTTTNASHSMIRVGNYLYAAVNDGTISYYTIASNGSLNTATTVTMTGYTAGGGNTVPRISADPSGAYLFGLSDNQNMIFSFVIGSGGGLTQSSNTYTTNQSSPSGVGALVF
jgi:6-phosphogluconolactonase (cycloisomerase 2 family)